MERESLLRRVIEDPEIRGGKPCIRGTEVTVATILDALAEGITAREVAERYPQLTEDDVRAALVYASRMADPHFRKGTLPCEIDEATIQEAVRRLREAAPGSRVILFGSYARGDVREDSDLDFLVVEPEVKSRRQEMVRLRNVLRPLRIPVEVLVTSEDVFREWSAYPGTVYHQAAQEGRVFHAVA